jgi:hypothetical protein
MALYDLNEKGEAREQAKFLKLTDNLRFSFRALAWVLGSDYELDVRGNGWAAFRQAVTIRNRLMHPKCVKDLDVTEEDLKHVRVAVAWYKKSTLELGMSWQKENP